jgi:hypothetical protein
LEVSLISYLAEKSQGSEVFKTELEDGFVLWRVISWGEFKSLRSARETVGDKLDIDIEEAVYSKAVFFSSFDRIPPSSLSEEEQSLFIKMDRDNQDAGIVSTVVKAVLSASGVTKAERIFSQLEQARSLIGTIEDQMAVIICRAFPSYTPEDVEKMTWPTVLKRVSQAEMILMGYSVELPIRQDTGKTLEDEQREGLGNIIDRVNSQAGPYMDEDDPDNYNKESEERRREISERRASILRQRGF